MVSAYIFIEGAGDSKELHTRCREGFRKLLESCGLAGRMPRLVACGGRSQTFNDFTTAHNCAPDGTYVAMLLDSEDPISNVDETWEHLKSRDGWDRPSRADDSQVLLMATCMETWIVSDRAALRRKYSADLQENALPPLSEMESRTRAAVQNALTHATRNCKNAYAKGKRSFEIVGMLTPNTLRPLLPSFSRFETILKTKL